MSEQDESEGVPTAVREVAAMIRQAMPIIRKTQQYAGEVRKAQAAAGQVLSVADQVAIALDAGMRELLAAIRQQPEHKTVYSGFKGYISFTGQGALAPMGMTGAVDVGAAIDTLSVQKKTQSDSGMPLDAKTVLLAVLWVFTILLPLKDGHLPQEVQTKIWEFITVVNFTLTIHWRVTDSRNRKP